MNRNINEIVLSKILNFIPDNVKPVNFFMDILDIGEATAYRRIRGEKYLSFEDIFKLSQALGFSLDTLTESENPSIAVFNYFENPGEAPEEAFLRYFRSSEDFYLKKISVYSDASHITSINNIFLLPLSLKNSENLLKLYYFKWIHQVSKTTSNLEFSKIVLPKSVSSAYYSMLKRIYASIKKVTYIVDMDLYLSVVKEIQYYHLRGLINDDELEILKKELIISVNNLEEKNNGILSYNDQSFEMYLSVFNIDTNVTYTLRENHEKVMIWLDSMYPLSTSNERIIKRHKDRVDALKRYSTIISKSNELLQSKFFNKQREYINNIYDYKLH